MRLVHNSSAAYFQNIHPFQEDENTLTNTETTLLEYLQPWIQDCLDKKISIVYIEISQPLQNQFTEWVKKTYTARKYSDKELDLNLLVTSIWQKTRNRIENQLTTFENQADIIDEKSSQCFADMAMKQIISRGHTGKVFTERQAKLLLTDTDIVA